MLISTRKKTRSFWYRENFFLKFARITEAICSEKHAARKKINIRLRGWNLVDTKRAVHLETGKSGPKHNPRLEKKKAKPGVAVFRRFWSVLMLKRGSAARREIAKWRALTAPRKRGRWERISSLSEPQRRATRDIGYPFQTGNAAKHKGTFEAFARARVSRDHTRVHISSGPRASTIRNAL